MGTPLVIVENKNENTLLYLFKTYWSECQRALTFFHRVDVHNNLVLFRLLKFKNNLILFNYNYNDKYLMTLINNLIFITQSLYY